MRVRQRGLDALAISGSESLIGIESQRRIYGVYVILRILFRRNDIDEPCRRFLAGYPKQQASAQLTLEVVRSVQRRLERYGYASERWLFLRLE